MRGLGWGALLQSRLLKEDVDCEERRLANHIFSAPRGAFTLAAAPDSPTSRTFIRRVPTLWPFFTVCDQGLQFQ